MGNLIMTFFIAMVPIAELRAAIPFAVANDINPFLTYMIVVIGNMVPVPFIIIFIRRIFKILREKSPKMDGCITRLEKKADIKAETVRKYEKFGLFLLVAIPLPGTGAWTGALVAAMLDMRLKSAIPMIFLGVCAAGGLVMLLTLGVIRI